jgi:hypothetical protein
MRSSGFPNHTATGAEISLPIVGRTLAASEALTRPAIAGADGAWFAAGSGATVPLVLK